MQLHSLRVAHLRHRPLPVLLDERSVMHDVHHHRPGELQIRHQLRRDQKILRRVALTRRLHQQVENPPLIVGVHPLIDLVDAPERHRRQLLQRQHEHRRRHRSLAAALHHVVQLLERLSVPVRHLDAQSVLGELLLIVSLVDRDLAGATHPLESPREVGVDLRDELAEWTQPLLLQRVHLRRYLARLEVAPVDALLHTFDQLQKY
jgi:hypothetical protein